MTIFRLASEMNGQVYEQSFLLDQIESDGKDLNFPGLKWDAEANEMVQKRFAYEGQDLGALIPMSQFMERLEQETDRVRNVDGELLMEFRSESTDDMWRMIPKGSDFVYQGVSIPKNGNESSNATWINSNVYVWDSTLGKYVPKEVISYAWSTGGDHGEVTIAKIAGLDEVFFIDEAESNAKVFKSKIHGDPKMTPFRYD